MTRILIMRSNGNIIIGKKASSDQDDLNYIELEDPNIIQFIRSRTENEYNPVLVDYPTPFIKSFIKESSVNKKMNRVLFNKKEIFIFDEDDINPMLLDWYIAEHAKKSGIHLATEVPK